MAMQDPMSPKGAFMAANPGSAPTLAATQAPEVGQEIPVNVYATDRAVVVVAPMPGITEDDLLIELDGRDLTISSEVRTPADKDYLVREFEYGGYHRTIDLPHRPGGDPIISLGNGLLAVTVPRADAPDDVLTADALTADTSAPAT